MTEQRDQEQAALDESAAALRRMFFAKAEGKVQAGLTTISVPVTKAITVTSHVFNEAAHHQIGLHGLTLDERRAIAQGIWPEWEQLRDAAEAALAAGFDGSGDYIASTETAKHKLRAAIAATRGAAS